jgi:hypothetical protein
MPHESDRTTPPRYVGAVLSLLVALPLVAHAQSQAALRVEAVVLSPEATRTWQAVARQLAPATRGETIKSAGATDLVATITDVSSPPDRLVLSGRRVVTVEYLRN